MKIETLKALRRRVHSHTVRAMSDYCDSGHGPNVKAAVKSAERLIDYVSELAAREYMLGHSTGWSEARKGQKV